eukprot:6210846-Pleurochrysis_carterae.AAC.3
MSSMGRKCTIPVPRCLYYGSGICIVVGNQKNVRKLSIEESPGRCFETIYEFNQLYCAPIFIVDFGMHASVGCVGSSSRRRERGRRAVVSTDARRRERPPIEDARRWDLCASSRA